VLAYGPLLGGDTVASSAGRADPGVAAGLAGCLDEHFDGSDGPTRLVYLLDHEGTQRALGWAPRALSAHVARPDPSSLRSY
jgi:hypothetical protein